MNAQGFGERVNGTLSNGVKVYDNGNDEILIILPNGDTMRITTWTDRLTVSVYNSSFRMNPPGTVTFVSTKEK